LLKTLEQALITSQLEYMIRRVGWQTPLLKLLPVFLDKADTCSSFHEMLMLKVHDLSFWQVWLLLGERPLASYCVYEGSIF